MDLSRCPGCKKRLIAMTDRESRTKLVCLKCDNVDPMKTVAIKWADSSLASDRGQSPTAERRSR
jgi:DNA-directed RNA polymerase subunit M/transcription elongation factor TFIIS